MTAFAAPTLNAVVIVKVDVLVAVAAVVTVTLAATLADGVAAGLFAALSHGVSLEEHSPHSKQCLLSSKAHFWQSSQSQQ